jgi:hypothetical protein
MDRIKRNDVSLIVERNIWTPDISSLSMNNIFVACIVPNMINAIAVRYSINDFLAHITRFLFVYA